jgi:hypothetical protein
LVRADKGRNRKAKADSEEGEGEEDIGFLWDKLKAVAEAGRIEVTIPRNGSRSKRVATCVVRYAKVELQPPLRKKEMGAVPLWAVYVAEVGAGPEVKEPLEWMLLTNVEVSTVEQAIERVQWYTKRWGIEIYHRVLKSGCRIEDRRLGTATQLENCLAIDMVVAWRIYCLTMQGRETPNIPCDTLLSESEWKVLWIVVHRTLPPEQAPPLQEVVRMMAGLGGFLGRKGDGQPGTITLWRGLQRVEDAAMAYDAIVHGGLLEQLSEAERKHPSTTTGRTWRNRATHRRRFVD